MATLILSTLSVVLMFMYLGYILVTLKNYTIKEFKRRIIFCNSLAVMCLITSVFYFLEPKAYLGVLWIINTALWLFNTYINFKSYQDLKND
jgi:hypothetical protein